MTQTTPPDHLAEKRAQLAENLREIDAAARAQILQRAQLEGWSESQAAWLDILAKEKLLQDVVDGVPVEQALPEAYGHARRQLTVGYFQNALEKGQSRVAAFLTVIDLEKQLAGRRGAPIPEYGDDVLMAACGRVEQAAAEGQTPERQVAAGFAEIQQLLAEARDAPRH